MKTYLIFIKLDEIPETKSIYNFTKDHRISSSNGVVALYGFTNKKSIIKEFISSRDTKYFIIMKSKRTIKELTLKYPLYALKTCKFENERIYFPITEQENQIIQNKEFYYNTISKDASTIITDEVLDMKDLLNDISNTKMEIESDNLTKFEIFMKIFGLSMRTKFLMNYKKMQKKQKTTLLV